MPNIDFKITIIYNSSIAINTTKVVKIVNDSINEYLPTSYDLNNTVTVEVNTITLMVSVDDENIDVNINQMERKIEEDLNKEYENESVFIVNVEEVNKSQYDTQNIVNHYEIIMLITLGLLMMVVMAAYIHSKCVSVNDFFRIGALMTSSLHIMDALSDIFFSANIESTLILIISIVFIIVPVLLTLYQLYHAINKWKRIDELSQWLSDNVQFLYIISAITGSSFAGVVVCTSNAFNLTQTDMPLNKTQFLQFQTKRIYSTVLVENIPQLALQILLLISYGGTSDIVYISMTFSILSIVISVLSMVSQRNIIRSRDYVCVAFDVTGPMIVNNMNKCRNRVSKLQIQLASLLGVQRGLVEITRPEAIKKGVRVRANIFVNNAKAIDMNIEKEMNQSNQSGELAEMVQISWELSKVPLIGTVKYSKYESKERRENKIIIKASSEGAKNTTVMMSRIISNSDMNNIQSLPPQIPQVLSTTPGAVDTFDEGDTDEECSNEQGYTTKGIDKQ
eukprot:556154_1